MRQLTYEDYRSICYKLHCKMTKAFFFLLKSEDMTLVRKAMIVLTNVRAGRVPRLGGRIGPTQRPCSLC